MGRSKKRGRKRSRSTSHAAGQNPRLLPVAQLAHASALAFADPEIRTAESCLEYGPDEGYGPLRRSVAAWLTGFFYAPREPVGAARVCVTGGCASQGLAGLLLTFTDPAVTRAVWVVAPNVLLRVPHLRRRGVRGGG